MAITVLFVHVEELGAEPVDGARIDEMTKVVLNGDSGADISMAGQIVRYGRTKNLLVCTKSPKVFLRLSDAEVIDVKVTGVGRKPQETVIG